MTIQPYLNFDGRCEEAVEFYKQALGAEVEMMMRFKDNPEPPSEECPMPGDPNKVMHTSLRIGDTVIMASDCECTGKPEFKGISLALTVTSEAEADRAFGALSNSGKILMPMGKTFFSPKFGMTADKFGISWMIMVEPAQGHSA